MARQNEPVSIIEKGTLKEDRVACNYCNLRMRSLVKQFESAFE